MKLNLKTIIGVCLLVVGSTTFAQQDPQFTQYMYNTLSVNSAYAGTRGHVAITAIHRSQWAGLEGAPETQTLTFDSPIGRNLGLGISIVQDKLGPSKETYFDANLSYSIKTSKTHRLSLGLKGGLRLLNIDWSRGNHQASGDVLFQENINRTLPTLGAGLYYYSEKSYLGFSIPNFFADQHYDDIQGGVATERLHMFFIGGLVRNISDNIKFKPAFLLKSVSGAPLILDLSANFMFNEKFRLGASYRWDDSVSGLIGLQVSPKLLLGYSYDYTTTELQRVNSGTHEFMLRFELISKERKLKSPRFF
ncbi:MULTISPECIES: PorP/SprF family type IX secretion system membrane protein [Tenacibaculum]|uniref:PorP/SprF family type IX secretion system membrane protein n=1 Tax=Tenacibaculum TaxID=104267 RepID=UPI001F0A7EFF|nr:MULTISPECIES: type IX secretion system membrane protein PorP/SprF [Tenacibaculum]MCH3882891.1 type IX secretion system membrane protein PorP/SprF [Tenacibaculum aquimarinum]MCH3884378.1 type IX secretion system membrane protein PorP/SprF [Tenacibaculum aquimarinum]MDO6600400.1 type IX secretion system membrane protein PorP/SprF [Tenacibaculum sp. 1_MG-2023]